MVGVILRLYWDHGKENGNHYSVLYWGYKGMMEKRMETTIVYWGYIGTMEKRMETTIVYCGCIGIMEKKMETTRVYWGFIGIMEKKMETTVVYCGYKGIMGKITEITIVYLCKSKFSFKKKGFFGGYGSQGLCLLPASRVSTQPSHACHFAPALFRDYSIWHTWQGCRHGVEVRIMMVITLNPEP